MAIDLHKLTYDEIEIVEGLVNNPVNEQQKEILEYYCGNVNYRLIDRVNRYLLMNVTSNLEGRIEFIAKILDKYNMMYNHDFILKQIEDKEYRPLKKLDDRIRYYQSEIDLIKSLEGWVLQKYAFALLTYAKYNLNVHGHTDILNSDDLMVDIFNICGAGAITKENVYFLLHELVKKDLLTIPISLKSFEDKIKVNYVEQDENAVPIYELGNTEIFNLGAVFEKLFGEYRDVQAKYVLEIGLTDTYVEVHDSIAQAMKTHNERSSKRVTKSAISECMKLSRMSIGECAWIELNHEDKDDEQFIAQIAQFIHRIVKPNFRKAKKAKGKWIISKEFLGCIDENGEVLYQM